MLTSTATITDITIDFFRNIIKYLKLKVFKKNSQYDDKVTSNHKPTFKIILFENFHAGIFF